MKKIFLAGASLALMLYLPALIRTPQAEPYLILHPGNVKEISTYREAYHELMKRMSALARPQKEETVVVAAWQDSDGNMYFSNQGPQAQQNSQQYEVKNHYTGRLAFPRYWVWSLMAAVWLVIFLISHYSLSLLSHSAQQISKIKKPVANTEENRRQNSKNHERINYEKVEPTTSPYKVLGISDNAGLEEIKIAYRNKVKQYHPDKVAHLGKELQEVARQKTITINRAYEILAKKK